MDKLFNIKNRAYLIGVIAITVVTMGSMLMNARYVYTNYNVDIVMVIIFTGVALSFDAMKPFLLGMALSTYAKGRTFYLNATLKVMAWIVLASCSAFFALSTVSDAVMHNPSKELKVSNLEKQLNNFKGVRSLEKLQVFVIEARSAVPTDILKSTVDCTDITLPKSRAACLPLLKLRAEHADARSRFKIQKQYEITHAAGYGMEPTNAAMMVSVLLLDIFDKKVTPEKIDMFRILGFAAAIELISALGYSLMRVPRRNNNNSNTSKKPPIFKQQPVNKKPLSRKDIKVINDKTAEILENALKEVDTKHNMVV